MKTIINESMADEILPGIWLGNYEASQNLNFIRTNKIKYIINVSDNLPNNFPNLKYLNHYIKDIKICKSEYSFYKLCEAFDQTFHFIVNAIKSHSNLLIHCKRGHHRSASFLAVFISRFMNVSLEDSMKYIKYHRPLAFKRETCVSNYLKLYIDIYGH